MNDGKTMIAENWREIEYNNRDIEVIYLELKDAVYSYALSIVRNTSVAEDVMHDVFTKVIEKSYTLKDRRSLKPWIMKICRNTALNTFPRINREVELDDATYIENCMLEDEVIGNDYVTSLLKTLLPIEREVVVLHLILGFKHYQIAGIIDKSYSAVRRYYSQAMRKLRETITLEELVNEQI